MASPLDLLQPAPTGHQWTVLHTRPRCEKKVEALQRLRPADIFLPCLERVHSYGNRTRRYTVPLFTGYVFARLRDEDLNWYAQQKSVANLINVVGEKKFLTPLRAIATALDSGAALEVHPGLRPGQRVRITGGSMKGLEAEISDILGENRIVIRIEMIQQSVSLEMDPAFIKSFN